MTLIKEKGRTTMKIGYVRVSTIEQNEARQLETMRKFEVEKVFSEKISAKDVNRPKLAEMIEFAREGDIIYIHDFSRLARSTKDLLNIIETLNNKHVNLVSYKEDIDTQTPTGRLLLTVIAAINTFERENLLERQREGIELAKKRGAYKGRKPIQVADFEKYYTAYKERALNKTQMAKKLNLSRPTLNKLIKNHEKSLNTAITA